MTRRWYRDPFAVAAALLTCVAFAVSFAHTRATIVDHGGYGLGATATALMPEAMVLLSVLWIRRGGRDPRVRWAWFVLTTAVAFTLWGNLAQAEASLGGYVVAGWPAWAAIGAAGFVELRKPDVEVEVEVCETPTPVKRQRAPKVTTGVPGVLPAPLPTALAVVALRSSGARSGTGESAYDRALRIGRAHQREGGKVTVRWLKDNGVGSGPASEAARVLNDEQKAGAA